MIVKILSSSAAFNGVRYNTNKIDTGKGELMLVRNFGALQGLSGLRPEDYRNYLKMISATNKAVKNPQFHAAISAEGRSYDKQALTEIAEGWLNKMGYGDQPYLVVFHKDTANNHVHIVTTRINREGRKISSGFENIRAVNNLNQVLGVDETQSAKLDIENALAYAYSTNAQFMMILECQCYKMIAKEDMLSLVKFGKVQADVSLSIITGNLRKDAGDDRRKKQVAALLYKYAPQYNTAGLTELMKQQHGLILLFHAKDGKAPYGYSIIDHTGKAVYKGSEIMPLATLLGLTSPGHPQSKKQNRDRVYKEGIPESIRRDYYKAMLNAAIHNYPDIRQGLHHTGISIYFRDEKFYLVDNRDKEFILLDQLLTAEEYKATMHTFAHSGELGTEVSRHHINIPAPIIAASIDDEAIHGRNRKRRRHPRTNCR
ncbi:MAG: relaxase/mobilization nuclease domain-containing protein [Bacteroidetes bacterium]|nr:relaxase/mobilization nuclease domain-containing protein [Bacteroidota bacterium]